MNRVIFLRVLQQNYLLPIPSLLSLFHPPCFLIMLFHEVILCNYTLLCFLPHFPPNSPLSVTPYFLLVTLHLFHSIILYVFLQYVILYPPLPLLFQLSLPI